MSCLGDKPTISQDDIALWRSLCEELFLCDTPKSNVMPRNDHPIHLIHNSMKERKSECLFNNSVHYVPQYFNFMQNSFVLFLSLYAIHLHQIIWLKYRQWTIYLMNIPHLELQKKITRSPNPIYEYVIPNCFAFHAKYSILIVFSWFKLYSLSCNDQHYLYNTIQKYCIKSIIRSITKYIFMSLM